MFFKNIKFILILLLFYQNPSYSKSRSSENFDAKNLSNYFSGIIALENKNNSYALSFFDSSKSLINKHDPFIEKYITSLVLENKVSRAVNIIKGNIEKLNFVGVQNCGQLPHIDLPSLSSKIIQDYFLE